MAEWNKMYNYCFYSDFFEIQLVGNFQINR